MIHDDSEVEGAVGGCFTIKLDGLNRFMKSSAWLFARVRHRSWRFKGRWDDFSPETGLVIFRSAPRLFLRAGTHCFVSLLLHAATIDTVDQDNISVFS